MSARTTTDRPQFTGSMRFLHWLMAAMVLAMLGVGVAMVASLGDYHRLVSIHRPLGILILILTRLRLRPTSHVFVYGLRDRPKYEHV